MGYIFATISILVWGLSFISSKILLEIFTPLEILVYRFLIAYIALWIFRPKLIKFDKPVDELFAFGAALSGIVLYYVLETIALTMTRASNVGVITSLATVFTAVFCSLAFKEEKLSLRFFLGCLIAFFGIIFISYSGSTEFKMNPLGDFCALLSAISWGIYSLFMKKLLEKYDSAIITRRIFFYGLLILIALTPFMNFSWKIPPLNTSSVVNILFLGLGASALSMVTWNLAIFHLGAVKSSIFIYIIPIITVLGAWVILKEEPSLISSFGIFLVLLGLIVSEKRRKRAS